VLSHFIIHRPAWRLTWLSRGLGVLILGAGVWIGIHRLYPFLAPADPVPTSVLVVEGWMPDTALAVIAAQVRSGRYSQVFLTGGAILQNDPNSTYSSYPDLMKAALVKRGIASDRLSAVPAPAVVRDRTYASALALRRWLQQHQASTPAFNLLTAGPHARRSRLLFGKAFGYGVRIGVIPVAPDDYDSRVWWQTSAGFREVVGETIAYTYARCFFHP
jgi:hypothetical protein